MLPMVTNACRISSIYWHVEMCSPPHHLVVYCILWTSLNMFMIFWNLIPTGITQIQRPILNYAKKTCQNISSYMILMYKIPSCKRLHSYGKSPFFMGKSTISMAIFHSYVKFPEGTNILNDPSEVLPEIWTNRSLKMTKLFPILDTQKNL